MIIKTSDTIKNQLQSPEFPWNKSIDDLLKEQIDIYYARPNNQKGIGLIAGKRHAQRPHTYVIKHLASTENDSLCPEEIVKELLDKPEHKDIKYLQGEVPLGQTAMEIRIPMHAETSASLLKRLCQKMLKSIPQQAIEPLLMAENH